MRIAICDDEAICRAQLLDWIDDYQEERKDRDLKFELFSAPEALLQATRQGHAYDIYLLDIVMPDTNGIQLGEVLRDNHIDGKIIYLTSSTEYALDSYCVRAFNYLLKPLQKESFYHALDEAVNSIHIKKDKCTIIKTRDSNARIAFDSISYVELAGRILIYHLNNGSIVESTTIRCPFTEAVSDLLTDQRFLQCGAGNLFNLNHITSIENESVIFADIPRVYLNKKLCRDLRSAWTAYWISQEG